MVEVPLAFNIRVLKAVSRQTDLRSKLKEIEEITTTTIGSLDNLIQRIKIFRESLYRNPLDIEAQIRFVKSSVTETNNLIKYLQFSISNLLNSYFNRVISILAKILEEAMKINDNELAGTTINAQNILIRGKENLNSVIKSLNSVESYYYLFKDGNREKIKVAMSTEQSVIQISAVRMLVYDTILNKNTNIRNFLERLNKELDPL